MQIEKILINDHIQKYPQNFAFKLFIILQYFTREIYYFFDPNLGGLCRGSFCGGGL